MESIEPLTKLLKLQQVDLSRTQVRDLTPLVRPGASECSSLYVDGAPLDAVVGAEQVQAMCDFGWTVASQLGICHLECWKI
ncbi:MAG: hypothetical protein QM756_42570 [Polyangiaceae bacterium]